MVQLTGAARGGPTAFSPTHVETLKVMLCSSEWATSRTGRTLKRWFSVEQDLGELEKRAMERLEAAVRAEGFRYRPSLVLPAVHCGSQIVGALAAVGTTLKLGACTHSIDCRRTAELVRRGRERGVRGGRQVGDRRLLQRPDPRDLRAQARGAGAERGACRTERRQVRQDASVVLTVAVSRCSWCSSCSR